jgi:CRP-like cAMP-binding protein
LTFKSISWYIYAKVNLIKNMVYNEKQLHIRLPVEIYRELKTKCASELISMQDYVSNSITFSLDQNLLEKPSSESSEDRESHALKVLEHFPLFHDVKHDDLVKLSKAAVILHFKKGDVIIREGDIPTLYYIIAKGSVRVSKISQSGKEYTIVIRHEAETFGLPSVIKGTPHIASSIAFEATEVLAIERNVFLDFIAGNPIVMSRIIDTEMERTSSLYERMIEMTSYSAPQRVAKILYILYSEYGDTLRFTHEDIATLCWTTTETTTRVITRLKNADVIRSDRGMIQIKDPTKLRLYGENIHSLGLSEDLT